MTGEILDKLVPLGIQAYIEKLIAFPLETLLRLAPVSLLVLWSARRNNVFKGLLADQPVRTALAIAAIVFIPFWLAPQSHFRYIVPVLPLIALVLAVAVFKLGDASVRTTMRWLWGAAVIFPIYQHRVRGENYALTAREVLRRTAGFALYSNDVSAAGLSVTAYMNIQRLPQRALTFAPLQWDNGFAISNVADETLGKINAQYPLGGDTLYLHCRGVACAAPVQR
jgi:hypothetical protein